MILSNCPLFLGLCLRSRMCSHHSTGYSIDLSADMVTIYWQCNNVIVVRRTQNENTAAFSLILKSTTDKFGKDIELDETMNILEHSDLISLFWATYQRKHISGTFCSIINITKIAIKSKLFRDTILVPYMAFCPELFFKSLFYYWSFATSSGMGKEWYWMW